MRRRLGGGRSGLFYDNTSMNYDGDGRGKGWSGCRLGVCEFRSLCFDFVGVLANE